MTDQTSLLTDLNTADEEVLARKLRISTRLAKRIITLRPYQSVEELDKVWGMDPRTLRRILSLLDEPEAPEEILNNEEAEPAPVLPAESQPAPQKVKTPWQASVLLALILFAGAYFRFTGLNWDEGQHQHPDERYISMVVGQIESVKNLGEYFDALNSPLNPLRFGSYTYGMFPLFFTRTIAEWLGMSDYDTVTLVGRAMSGIFDLLAVWALYLLGTRLYDRRIGILAAALGAAAVFPIQLSHYFTVDSFSTVFVIAGFYFALQAVPIHADDEKISWSNLLHFALFGLVIGLAGACKVNTLPVFGIIALAGAARIFQEWKKPSFSVALAVLLAGSLLAAFSAFASFRMFQPYAFEGPGFWDVTLNQKWLNVIKEVVDHVAGNSDWPPNTHWTNRPITYAWVNMVVWGLGIPLGLMAWFGWAWAAWRIWNGDWSRHLLPFTWVTGYFIWQNMQFWRYMRYFLPIYPFLILFAAWALVEVYDRTHESRQRLLAGGIKPALQFSAWRANWQGAVGLLLPIFIVIATYVYALAFTQIYNRPMTRIAASEWMLENIPAPLNVIVDSPAGSRSYPVAVTSRQMVEPGYSSSANIHVLQHGTVSKITSTDIRQVGVSFYFRLTTDQEGNDIITEGRLAVSDDDTTERHLISFGDTELNPGATYFFHYRIQSSSQFSVSSIALRNVDENRPVLPLDFSLESQSGTLQGAVPLTVQEALILNRLEIGGFQQTFIPNETVLKLGIYKEGSETPLMETLQPLAFNQPGQRLSPTFKFSPVEVFGGQTYQVRYEIAEGVPLRILADVFTLETSWDDALPLNINRYDVQGGIFIPLNLELYEPDTPEKREAMIQTLEQSNYIVIPSNRAYDAMPRLPLRYPLTLKYYQTLFDCDCIGDELENKAYGLQPPFKSPLGFELIAVFESPPSLGFLTFNDQWADESFTVYDHPKVMIFKKTQDFSSERVSALLNGVDLDKVFFQIPLEYTQAPLAMQLPADRIESQRNSGAWASAFDRASALNANQFLGGLAWYLFLFLLGLAVFPLIYAIFPWLPDRGYPLARIAGVVLVAWLAWMLGSYAILPFTNLTIFLCVGAVLIPSAALAYRSREAFARYFSAQWKYILGIEALFLAAFLFSLSIRIGNPDLWHPWLGGEKPMDLAFFNAILRTVYFPPEHPWFAEHYINYYYYGAVLAAIPTKALGILPAIAYNLVLPSWFAMTGVGVFSVAFNLVTGMREEDNAEAAPASRTWFKPYWAGAIALVLTLLLGNLYQVAVLWRYLPEATVNQIGEDASPGQYIGAVIGGAIRVVTGQTELPGNNGRWYFEASRPILPQGPDTPIAEFPYFTFLYGDMHPHMLVMPVYALALGWILNLLFWKSAPIDWLRRIPGLIAAGLIFGIFRAAHTWDFPTFVGLGVLAILWHAWQMKTASVRQSVQFVFVYVLAFAAIAVAFYQPFAEWFKTEYASLELWRGSRTPLSDYLFVFGLSLFVMITLLAQDLYPLLKAAYQAWVRDIKQRLLHIFRWTYLWRYLLILSTPNILAAFWLFDYQVLALGVPLLAAIAWTLLFRRDLPLLRQATWLLFGIGLTLTMFVEVFVLKGDAGRSNTVFRFYNQVWFIFGLAVSLALLDLLPGIRAWRRRVQVGWILTLAALVLAAASYPLIATEKKITDRWPDVQNPPHTLNGSLFMIGDPVTLNPAMYNDDNRPINLGEDYAAILFMQDQVDGSPVFVEGHTEEYRWGSRFSIYTGLPSVVGWSWHVRQHNSLLDGAIVDRLIEEVNNFYNTVDIQSAAQFLEKRQVRYIVMGDLERGYYDAPGLEKFQKMVDQGLLKMVFGDGSVNTTTIYEAPGAK